jgi:CMP-N,N'-diacetyllegionaminic acid synthase
LTVLALIPARGGSKGIPGKNIAPLCGKPLIAWTIEAAQRARGIDRIVVSTDDEPIAEVARSLGAEVPFMRPTELARDDTPGIAPPLHALRWLAEHEGYRPDALMLLQPTSPLRLTADIEGALELFQRPGIDSVVSVTEAHHHPYLLKTMGKSGHLQPFMVPDQPYVRRQDLPPLFALNGALWLIRSEILLAREEWYTDHTLGYIMPPERSLDVDTPFDLRLCELILADRTSEHS